MIHGDISQVAIEHDPFDPFVVDLPQVVIFRIYLMFTKG